MGERGSSPFDEKMSRREFLKKAAKITAVGAGLAMGLRGDKKPAPAEKEVIPPKESPEENREELFRQLFAEIPEPSDPEIKRLTELEKNKLKSDFKRRLDRASPYLLHSMKIFQTEGVPAQLALLSLPESGFEITATSRRQAHGPFQFTEATAKNFGLTINQKIDERRDPFLASRAAARYLNHLFQEKGSWEMAIFAYNSGLAFRYEGNWTDYIKHLTKELSSAHKITRRSAAESLSYLPRFFAARQLFQEHLLAGHQMPPAAELSQFQCQIPETRKRQTHTVKKGDNLFRLARQLKVGLADLKHWNSIPARHTLQIGQKLVYFPGEPNTLRPREITASTSLSLENLAAANPSWSARLIENNDRFPANFHLNLPGGVLTKPGSPLDRLVTESDQSHYHFRSPDFWKNLKEIISAQK